MKIALAQLNPIVGDLAGNCRLIEQAAKEARQTGAQLLVTSELCVSGYPPKDLLYRDGFVEACEKRVQRLATLTDDSFGILVGHPSRHGCGPDSIANSASLLFQGQVTTTIHKTLLPNYDVFDEKRYFQAADRLQPIEFLGHRLGVHICEDAWWGEPETFYHCPPAEQPDPVKVLAEQGVDLFINLSASPYEFGKVPRRHQLIRRHVERYRKPFLFVNQVGGNDDLVFDGNSFVMNAAGELVLTAADFAVDLQHIETAPLPPPLPPVVIHRENQLLQALTLGLGDYMRKCGFTDCVLGLSGGIDSALAACIAARAVGPERVHGILMPSRHSSQHSTDDARALAENLGMPWSIVPIDSVHAAYEKLPDIDVDLSSEPGGLADQNLQARIRGGIVMTRSNRRNWMALATGNKSELAVGYCTLYGDMCGGFAVLSDLYKRDVYSLSRYVNEEAGREIIPVNVIEKAPSAELAPNQFDQDTLPPYPILDGILHGLIDKERSPADLAQEFPPETVQWVVKRLDRNEFKRRQMPPGIKLSQRAFGSGRRMPMAARGFDGMDV
ncbi:NAD+ synthase [Planctomicrobium sp. SH661]|uniref:NAD+ synthase n=1 Tax=Planctomicrobium sp. SH661 TaxID=3448124 RepID=UPI003F5C0393